MIFIDTGAFIARFRASDDWHQMAVEGWRRLSMSTEACFASDLVVAESLKLIARYAGTLTAVRIGRQILSSQIIILRSEVTQELAALDIMEKFADQKINFVDCVSIALMRRHRITTVFGFDRHFILAGYHLWPERA